MSHPLRQSTASQEVPLGYFLGVSDGDTEMTGLTINNTDIKIWKAGATSLADKNSGGATHMANGIYYTVLDDTDTSTAGPLVIFIHVATALSIKVECVVHPGNVYDALYGTDRLQVHVDEMTAGIITSTVLATDAIGADELSAAALAKAADIILRRRLDSVEGSSYGDALHQWSLLAAALWNVADVSPSGSNLLGYQTDGTTVITTRAVTTDSGADPITALE